MDAIWPATQCNTRMSDPKNTATAASASGNPASPRVTFSQELRDLAAEFAERPVRFGEILEATKGRGFHLLLVLIALPFLTPIPLPGFSVPFGLVVAVIGARMALGQRPWLPKKLLSRELPPGFLLKVLTATGRVLKILERFLRPRLVFLHEQVLYRRLAGALISLSGLYLVLPLPVPFSNGLPAWTVLLLSAAALERDGLCFIAGCAMFMVATAFFVLLALGGAQTWDYLRQAIMGA
ncbi:MAG: Exopolysaccharide synthesis, ExoD [Chthoniobacteraceae bacterium]|nr:Exopolysaccharide synthesis, ExoD [Chthoniobacteraceae bacterium]